MLFFRQISKTSNLEKKTNIWVIIFEGQIYNSWEYPGSSQLQVLNVK